MTFNRGIIDVNKKIDFWKEVETQLSGNLKEFSTASNVFARLELIIPYKNQQITFKESDTKPLTISCELPLKKDFEFEIGSEDFIEKIMRIFGKQYIKINDPEFEKKYIIKSNNQKMIGEILKNKELKDCLKGLNVYYISLNNKILSATISRFVNSKNELLKTFVIFKFIIDKLIDLKAI